ncbi:MULTISPECIES: sensor domain-containing protein [Methylococcus]|uniref:EAL domain-containing protein n=1 Tax=Methylococcus capsulatus TaxID=414 RepID=A0ABZ2F3K2_METCP|nr:MULTISPECIES: EAL domain-containing protein [Methylococcus]MDF9392192.1 EAL domain-containing protein [Methylococcus capsulatus]
MESGETAAWDNVMFRAMIECLRDQVVTVHDMEDSARIIYANEAACHHFGVGLETLLTWCPLDFDPTYDEESLPHLLERYRQTGGATFETLHRVAGGTEIPVEVTTNLFEQDGKTLAVCISRDLRPRREAEARLKELDRLKAKRESLERLARFAQCAPGFMYTMEVRADGHLAMTYASSGVEDILGLSVEAVLDDIGHLYSRIVPEDRDRVMLCQESTGREPLPFAEEYRILHPVKGERWLEARSVPERHKDGVTLWHGFLIDITERKRMEETLQFIAQRSWARDGDAFFSTIAHYLGKTLGVDYVVIDRLMRDVNLVETVAMYARGEDLPTICYRLAGTPCENVVGRSLCCFPRQVRRLFPDDLILQDLEVESYAGVPLWDSAGTAIGLIAVMDGKPMADMDSVIALLQLVATRVAAALERDRSDRQLKAREREFRSLVEHSPDTVARYDRDCRCIYANPRLVKEAGMPLAELLGKTPLEFPGGESARAYQAKIQQVFETGEPAEYELSWKTAQERELVSHIRLIPEFGFDDEVMHTLAVGRDITEIDAYRRCIHHLAFFDSLTGLPNREMFNKHIREAMEGASGPRRQFALMMLDLDRFKEINDTLGHGIGDLLLSKAACRLLGAVGKGDTVARLGGDEFAVLVPAPTASQELTALAGRILGAFAQPFLIEGRELFASVSIGIALYPQDCTGIDTLFRYADAAMYHAKRQGRNNFQFYSADLTARAAERMRIESALRHALGRNELELHFQPQFDMVSKTIVGAEALLRWNRQDHGIALPCKFMPIAEETGLIVGIGEWVLAAACEAAVAWNDRRERPLSVAVNLSPRQFILNDLAGTVRRILEETGCRPEWLELEITENLLFEDSSEVRTILEDLDRMGLSIAIDDFGTGYSALSYLHRFPVKRIKIDRSFVHGVPTDRRRLELVKAMISIAQALRLEVLAEGVETPQQAVYLQAHGCRLAQGYLFGVPQPLRGFEALIGGDGRAVS